MLANGDLVVLAFVWVPVRIKAAHCSLREGQWPIEVKSRSQNPEVRGSIPLLGSRRSLLISIEHAELQRSTPWLGLCLASNHGIACALRLGSTQPVTDF